MNLYQHILDESIQIRETLKNDLETQQSFARIVEDVEHCFRNGGKLLLCGNGGSAGDAQHIAAELSGRFVLDREPLFAEALHVNSSYLTAVANDYGYDEVYARMVRAMGRDGDVLIGFSTSGNSKNVVKALEAARARNMTTIAFLGEKPGNMGPLAHHKLCIPSSNTARIQELHITFGHMLCQEVEQRIFGQ
jgi:D-sedoheptulose 7-phosphate isomerase